MNNTFALEAAFDLKYLEKILYFDLMVTPQVSRNLKVRAKVCTYAKYYLSTYWYYRTLHGRRTQKITFFGVEVLQSGYTRKNFDVDFSGYHDTLCKRQKIT